MAMSITRSRGETRRTEALATQIAGMATPCVGCTNCRGLCQELIEAIAVVESVELPVAKAQQLRVAVARTIVLQATVTRQKAVIDFTRNDDAIFSIT